MRLRRDKAPGVSGLQGLLDIPQPELTPQEVRMNCKRSIAAQQQSDKSLLRKLRHQKWTRLELEWLRQHLGASTPSEIAAEINLKLRALGQEGR
jgi:hypothetical protein